MRIALALLTITIAPTRAQATVFTDATWMDLRIQIINYCADPTPYAPIGTWDISALTNGNELFKNVGWGCVATDMHDINQWDTSSINRMQNIFQNTGSSLNSVDLSNWNVQAVTTINGAFSNTQFNGVIESWTFTNLQQMYYTFGNNPVFNRDISGWNVATVNQMYGVFMGATAFNQDLNAWAANPTQAGDMFNGATSFDQAITGWTNFYNRPLSTSQNKMENMFLNTGMSDCNKIATENAFTAAFASSPYSSYYSDMWYGTASAVGAQGLLSTDAGQWSTLTCTASPPPPAASGSSGDPHVSFAHGGKGDFRGANDTFFALLSAPGLQVAAKTVETDFLMPKPQLVHGSFFSDVAFRFRGTSGREYAASSSASDVSFEVFDAESGASLKRFRGGWKQWWEDGVRLYYKQSTVYIRAHGWEVNATRHPVYNYIAGPSQWRFDFKMRKLDGTPFAKLHGSASTSCYPHGLIGQSYDGDSIAINGRRDDYSQGSEIRTKAQLEGAIEGSYKDYALASGFRTDFAYSRYGRTGTDECAPRSIDELQGERAAYDEQSSVGSDE